MNKDRKSSTEVEGDFYTGNLLSHVNEMEPLQSTGKEKPRKKCSDFEEILNLIGSEGKFQKYLLYVILCPIVTVSPFLVLNVIFMLDIPDHWCHVPGGNSTDPLLWKNLTVPFETGPDGLSRYSQCEMYDPTFPFNKTKTQCQFGWDYDKTDYDVTIPSEFNWVCDKLHYATDCFTWSNVGSAVGTVIFGILADKYGRKPVFFASCAVNIIFKSLSLFVPHHINAFLLLQFLGGTAFPALFSMPALIAAEICSPEYRSWTYAVTWMIWVVGNSILPLVAWIARGWLLLGICSAVPGALLFFYYPVLNESPRWLITRGRGKEALEIIIKVAEANGTMDKLDRGELQQKVEDLIEKQEEDQADRNIGVWTLFQNFRLAKNTIFLCIAWSMNCILYYGITLNTTSMAGNKFLNYFLLSIIELPSGYLAGVLVEKTGRRWTQGAFFLLSVISCLLCALSVLNPDLNILVIIGALGIKFGVTITSLVVYLQGAEIFPTQLRSTGSGLASTISSTMGITGPYIVFTGKINAALPYMILCALSTVGLLSAISLPETFKQHLPETIEDANKFGKGMKFWSYLPEDTRNRKNNNDDKLSTQSTK